MPEATSSAAPKNICFSHHCVACCYDTQMMLLDDDVKRIVELGYSESYFARLSDGFRILKNSDAGRCVFHDGKTCTLYANRPKGCQLYPIIYDEDLMLAVKDSLCPHSREFKVKPKSKVELTSVYSRLMSERAKRRESSSTRNKIVEPKIGRRKREATA